MIVTEHVKINHTTFEETNLTHAIIFFDDIKNIDLNLLTINKNCIKILIGLVMKSDISQCGKIFIKKFLFVLELVI